MTSVTERFGVCVLATAPGDLFAFLDLGFYGREFAPLMRAVAERLRGGFAARTPPIGSWLHFQNKRPLLSNDRFGHIVFL
jgi:hypothetical protein